ncbi:DUF6801 domain-containing protein [Actinocrispum sp. NPDC049592]|uniref:DUF6801 domain-containing protein n=1 Tax=Actinocrispum sp. NPDC049592 TaxID=3154835 RepID=UPI003423C10F
MKLRDLRFSGRRIATVVVTAAMAAATITVGTAHAVSVTKNLTYRCTFPLVGPQDVAATVQITFPDTGTTGARIVNGDLSIVATLSANVVSALRAFQTATTEGSAVADVDASHLTNSFTLGVSGLKIAKQNVPASGTMPVQISGPTPSMIVYKAGNVVIKAGQQFNAKVDTRKANGQPTALGVLNVPCTVKATTPAQDLSLATIPVTGADVTPPDQGTPASGPVDKTLVYNCVFPQSGAVDVPGHITGTIPATGTVNQRLQPNLSIAATLPSSVADVLRANSAATVSGSGQADADASYNGSNITVGIPGPVPSVAVPASGDLTATLAPSVPSLAVPAAGSIVLSAGQQLNGTFTPLKADGTPTALGTFSVPCTLNPGQNPALGTIVVS